MQQFKMSLSKSVENAPIGILYPKQNIIYAYYRQTYSMGVGNATLSVSRFKPRQKTLVTLPPFVAYQSLKLSPKPLEMTYQLCLGGGFNAILSPGERVENIINESVCNVSSSKRFGFGVAHRQSSPIGLTPDKRHGFRIVRDTNLLLKCSLSNQFQGALRIKKWEDTDYWAWFRFARATQKGSVYVVQHRPEANRIACEVTYYVSDFHNEIVKEGHRSTVWTSTIELPGLMPGEVVTDIDVTAADNYLVAAVRNVNSRPKSTGFYVYDVSEWRSPTLRFRYAWPCDLVALAPDDLTVALFCRDNETTSTGKIIVRDVITFSDLDD